MTKLFFIQQELVAPKGQYNTFGKYHYRSAEDILESLKPICKKYEATIVISDKITDVGGWVFVEATATLTDDETGQFWMATASARHANEQKGMQESQISGSTSSYARKYALNGLFAIDDQKDDDTREPKAVETEPEEPASGLTQTCSLHKVKMTSKISQRTGNEYWSHKLPNGDLCFGNK